MPSYSFTVNGQPHTVEADEDMPLLWALRDNLALTGTKYGCGIGACGSCVVHVDGEPARSCVTPVALADGRAIVTIEGLSGDRGHPVQQAWLAEDVAQCGYCQSGQIMLAAALLNRVKKPTDAEIDEAMRDSVCRCGTYQRVRRAIHRAAEEV
jgi:aerobic-type carbon monoxide dehydrogenase small subunit (CoxS/CutS family)